MPQPTTHRVEIRAGDRDELRDLLRRHPIDLSRSRPRREADGSLSVEALVSAEELARIREGPWRVEVLEDAGEAGARSQAEVGRGDRWSGSRAIPRGLGRKE